MKNEMFSNVLLQMFFCIVDDMPYFANKKTVNYLIFVKKSVKKVALVVYIKKI